MLQLWSRKAIVEYSMVENIKSELMTKINVLHYLVIYTSADFRFEPSQWEVALLCNDVSYWLGASLESALHMHIV